MKSSRSVSSQAVAPKKSAKKTVSAATKDKVTRNSQEEVALRAYYIGERRRSLGMAGDEKSDWMQAEEEISQELKKK
jgi:hypothetical protein